MAKCWALWRSLKLCDELDFQRVQFEGDVQVVIKAVQQESSDWSWYSNLIDDLKAYFRDRPDWFISFVPKEGNKLAHALAKLG